MGFFALFQYNPDAYDACIEIIADMKAMSDTEPVRNPSAVLASAVEKARRIVYPDGEEHAGKNSVDVHADMW